MSIWRESALAELKPRPRLSMSEWADSYRFIAAGTSPEPQQWSTSRVPYMREIMDSMSNPNVETVALMAASQIGKSELLLNTIGYYAHQDPSAILFVQATKDAVESFAKERIEPTFRESPAFAGLFSDSLRDKDNTILLKQFPGGYLAMAWSTSSVALASRPIRIILGDEIDKWKDSTGKDGDPWHQAVQRTRNFFNRKILAISTPTIEGESRIERLYDATDGRRYWVPCPHCGASQVLTWEGVIYKRPDGEIDLSDVHYRCEHCAGRIEEYHRPEMIAAGHWQADEPNYPHEAGRERRGYQISALYSPWVRWRALAEEWCKVWADRDKRGQQEFVNLQLGEVWTVGGDEISAEGLEKNRDDYPAEVPDGVLLLTAGVDVQDNRLEAEIVGWGEGRESWGIHYAIIPGDTTNLGTGGPWMRLDALLARTWARADGSALSLWCACIDSGGHRTQEVYQFTRDRLARNIFAIKGLAGAGRPIAGKPTTSNQFRVPLYPVGVDTAKEALFSRLALALPGPGYCHFPRAVGAGYDQEFFKGLTSERRQPKVRAGRKVMVWVPRYARNEPLDCRNYATAAMELLSPDFATLATAARAPQPTSPTTRPARHRVHSSGVAW